MLAIGVVFVDLVVRLVSSVGVVDVDVEASVVVVVDDVRMVDGCVSTAVGFLVEVVVWELVNVLVVGIEGVGVELRVVVVVGMIVVLVVLVLVLLVVLLVELVVGLLVVLVVRRFSQLVPFAHTGHVHT